MLNNKNFYKCSRGCGSTKSKALSEALEKRRRVEEELSRL